MQRKEMCHGTSVRHRQSATKLTDSRRLAMRFFPVHSILWSSLLVLCASQNETEANNPDVCDTEYIAGDHYLHSPPEQGFNVEEAEVDDNFGCLLYPTNVLNCSWSFPTLQKETQLFVYISVCDYHEAGHSLNLLSVERVGSVSSILHVYEELNVFLRFNITMLDKWTIYTYPFDIGMLEVPPPPRNISASFVNGNLLVTWSKPHTRVHLEPICFEYQLDMGDQERPKNLMETLTHTEPNLDPTSTYSVRIRTKTRNVCRESTEWSDWSHAITVKQSTALSYKLNTGVIISISLGIPMILLAALLLVRYQRISKVLFPQIPCPPPKYKYFLEKNDTFNLFHPAPSAVPVEEITEVEDTEQKPR